MDIMKIEATINLWVQIFWSLQWEKKYQGCILIDIDVIVIIKNLDANFIERENQINM